MYTYTFRRFTRDTGFADNVVVICIHLLNLGPFIQSLFFRFVSSVSSMSRWVVVPVVLDKIASRIFILFFRSILNLVG